MPSVDDEIRALKRELASTRAKLSQDVRNEIMAQLALRGENVAPAAPPVEKRATEKPASRTPKSKAGR